MNDARGAILWAGWTCSRNARVAPGTARCLRGSSVEIDDVRFQFSRKPFPLGGGDELL